MKSFPPVIIKPNDDAVEKQSADIPKELDIYYRTEADFLPPGKTFADLTPEEREKLRNQYRFDPLKPGMQQTLSGFGNCI